MSQMTLRVSDELLEQVRRRAGAEGRSMNDYVTRILEAAVNPDVADTEVQQIRERLARAGVLAEEDQLAGGGPTAPSSRAPEPRRDRAHHYPTWSARTEGEHIRRLLGSREALHR